MKVSKLALFEAFISWLDRHETNTGRWDKLTVGERALLLRAAYDEFARDVKEAKHGGFYDDTDCEIGCEYIRAQEGGGCGDCVG